MYSTTAKQLVVERLQNYLPLKELSGLNLILHMQVTLSLLRDLMTSTLVRRLVMLTALNRSMQLQ